MAVIHVKVVSTHQLEGPRGRRYVFKVLEDAVQVERWEAKILTYRRTETPARARHLYAHLTRSCGYRRW